jgi:DNA-binding response OmpR family regulator
VLSDRIRILVVDDEPAICRALSIALERAGYAVRIALSGDTALAVLQSERVDLLLIDLRIPDTRGDVVFELAAASQPHLREHTLFMSGDLSERAHRLILSCKCPWIKKPFELRELIDAVRRLAPAAKDAKATGQSA